MGHGGRRPGAGRPKGATSLLPAGVKKSIQLINQLEENDPDRLYALSIVYDIMRGKIATRHTRERLSAAIWLLEQKVGRARQKLEVDVRDRTEEYEIKFAEEADSATTSTSDLPEGPVH